MPISTIRMPRASGTKKISPYSRLESASSTLTISGLGCSGKVKKVLSRCQNGRGTAGVSRCIGAPALLGEEVRLRHPAAPGHAHHRALVRPQEFHLPHFAHQLLVEGGVELHDGFSHLQQAGALDLGAFAA